MGLQKGPGKARRIAVLVLENFTRHKQILEPFINPRIAVIQKSVGFWALLSQSDVLLILSAIEKVWLQSVRNYGLHTQTEIIDRFVSVSSYMEAVMFPNVQGANLLLSEQHIMSVNKMFFMVSSGTVLKELGTPVHGNKTSEYLKVHFRTARSILFMSKHCPELAQACCYSR